ncbi:acetyltransferase [Burkholderia ubonensis]|uniref:N-acetyltransferase n=1 Tax=Burkholderia ubonensis TaxID=101571 RepID=UPI000758B5B3|nr:N-acetyltransferase [Burkholderia ubonensis]KVO62369.1 acetyltransferase [Burkholderia ubonensis]
MTLPPSPEPAMVEAIRYGWASDALRHAFAELQCRVYPEPESSGAPADVVLHDPSFDCLSFYICIADRVVSYAAAARKTIMHAGATFEIAGLSCVMTDPVWQGRGLGLRTVAAATRCMARSNLDIGIFTCDPHLAHFYAQAGKWEVARNVVVIGSRDERALRSDALGKAVLMRLFSARAIAAATTLDHATIDLDLPVGQFL